MATTVVETPAIHGARICPGAVRELRVPNPSEERIVEACFLHREGERMAIGQQVDRDVPGPRRDYIGYGPTTSGPLVTQRRPGTEHHRKL
jgi:hypothetical protein